MATGSESRRRRGQRSSVRSGTTAAMNRSPQRGGGGMSGFSVPQGNLPF